MTLSGLFIFATALLLTAGSPGPSVAALVSRVLANGIREVLPFLAAMWLGEALWLGCSVAGLAVLVHAFEHVFVALKYAGVLYLLYLAWKMWFGPPDLTNGELPKEQSPLRMFLAGLAVTLGNPKIMVFYLSLLPTIVDLSRVGVVEWAQLTLAMFIVLASVDLGWSILASGARGFLRSHRAVRTASRSGAVLMAGAAVLIAAR